MKKLACAAAVSLALALALPLAAGAEPDAEAVKEMKSQMEQMQKQMQLLQKKIEAYEKKTATTPAKAQGAEIPAPATAAPLAPPAAMPATAPPEQALPPAAPVQTWSPSQPITLMSSSSGANYMNMSFDVLTDVGTSTKKNVRELELGDHDPDQRGFSLRNAELALDGAVDPYFKGFANVVFKLDQNNETEVELEEAYGLTTSLPWNLQVKAGQFFAEFGRQNQMHPHTWAFVDEPLVMGRLLGSEGLRNVGTRISWLAPTPFYTEVLLGVFNGEGGTAYSFRDNDNTYGRTPVDRGVSSFGDLLYVPRVTSSFDLTDTQTLVVGASGAFGANDTGTNTGTELYGGDLYWKWRPERAQQGFPFLAWQSEGMYRRYEAGADPTFGLPTETLRDWGFYSQALWGFRLGWIAGLRGEFVSGNSSLFDQIDPAARADRTRISPNLTWYPTEFSKLRLQYNYDYGQEFGSESSIWLQAEFILGAHGAHKF